jgi:hypothetical protein
VASTSLTTLAVLLPVICETEIRNNAKKIIGNAQLRKRFHEVESRSAE